MDIYIATITSLILLLLLIFIILIVVIYVRDRDEKKAVNQKYRDEIAAEIKRSNVKIMAAMDKLAETIIEHVVKKTENRRRLEPSAEAESEASRLARVKRFGVS